MSTWNNPPLQAVALSHFSIQVLPTISVTIYLKPRPLAESSCNTLNVNIYTESAAQIISVKHYTIISEFLFWILAYLFNKICPDVVYAKVSKCIKYYPVTIFNTRFWINRYFYSFSSATLLLLICTQVQPSTVQRVRSLLAVI